MKSDYRIILFCLVLICCLVGVFFAVDSSVKPDSNAAVVDSAAQALPLTEEQGEGSISVVRRPFDPNTADSTMLLRLGLQPWMVRGILKYRAKGGVYSTPEDFARVPGLTQKQYKELLPYITISADYRSARELVGNRQYGQGEYPQSSRDTTRSKYPRKMESSERLAINTADTTALKRVPGIGSYFAKKIVALREKLGGFVSLDQLLEIKNFPESSLQYLTVPDGNIRKININKATFKQLSAHPYIGYSRAKAIFDYRRLKGNITSLGQLSLVTGFSKEERNKIEPYIEY